jgi:hypothetical protein
MNGDQIPQQPTAPGSQPSTNQPPAATQPTAAQPQQNAASAQPPSPQPAAAPVENQNRLYEEESMSVEPLGGGFFKADPANVPQATVRGKPIQLMQWSTADLTAPNRSSSWYLVFFIGLVVAAAAVYLLSRDIFATAAIVVVGGIFGVFGTRKPRAVSYVVDSQGILIGQKYYLFTQFRSFSVMHDNFGPGIALLPLARYMPMITVRFDSSRTEEIVNVLAERLPMSEHEPDTLDKIAHTFRF